jgi:peptidoglycan-associated lipoprotein
MTMKKLLLLILCSALPAMGQKKPTEKAAHGLFEKKAYLQAAAMYEQLKPNQKILQNKGDAYYNNGKAREATVAYGDLFFTYKDSVKPEYYFRYAHSLMGIGDYAKADVIMGEYLGYNVNTPRFIANLSRNLPYDHVVQTMAKNVTNGDFGIAFYGDKVAFASLRSADKPQYDWNDRPYLDLFSAVVNDKGQLTRIEPFPETINSKTHEATPTFSADGRVMYFSRTAAKRIEVNGEKFASVKIFRSQFKDGKWQEAVVTPFSSDEFSTEHPTLSRDGKKLYFSSDRPGGQGSFDIYVVDVNEDGTFGQPVNMGPTINTPHREQFPFINDDGTTLYFASDGHQGMGNLDIFLSKAYDGVFAKPVNLGETLNSGMDDFGYIINDETGKGYFASNRKGGDNLYSFVRVQNEKSYFVEGDVKDKNTKDKLPGTVVSLYEADSGKLIAQITVGNEAEYMFNTEPNKKYVIQAVRDFYIPHSEEFTTNDEGKLRYTIELLMECYDDAEEIITRRQDGKVQIVLENIYFDLDKWDIKPEAARVLDVLYDIMVKYPAMEIELGAHTDSRASDMYNLRLSNRRALATLNYLVSKGIDRKRMKSRGYGETQPLINCGSDCSEQQHAINRRCEFIITK